MPAPGPLAVVTDSTSDLTPQERQASAITSVPLYVLFGGQLYQDGVQISTADLIAGVRAGKKPPSTSQPSPAEFAAAYQAALDAGASEVLSIHISSDLSGTVGSARLAAQDFGGRVTVHDGRTVTYSLGLLALRAARRAQEGRSVHDIVRELERVEQHLQLRFTADSLDYLRLNGRIGGAQALLGGLLNIKPLMSIQNGKVGPAGRARGTKKAIAEMQDHVRGYVQQHGPSRVGFICTPGGEGTLDELEGGLRDLQFEDAGRHQIGAVIAAHIGPGAFGVALEPVEA